MAWPSRKSTSYRFLLHGREFELRVNFGKRHAERVDLLPRRLRLRLQPLGVRVQELIASFSGQERPGVFVGFSLQVENLSVGQLLRELQVVDPNLSQDRHIRVETLR